MALKISQLTALSTTYKDTDIIEVSVDAGAGAFVTRKMTFLQLRTAFTKLEANLDVNSFQITSASNGNIIIRPNGSGAVLIGGNSTQATELRFMEDSDNGTNYVALKVADALAASTTYTLPSADGTSGQVLSTNGSGTLSWATAGGGGLTVGTTAVSSGTVGRIFFQGSGDVVQQDSTLFWDNTNKRLGVGATPSTAVRLDVRAQGALSTDIAFRVRNSADTYDMLSINGAGRIYSRGNSHKFDSADATNYIELGLDNTRPTFRIFRSAYGGFEVNTSTDNREADIGITGRGKVCIGTSAFAGTVLPNEASSNVLFIKNGTAPALSFTDNFQLYSADITAGNAAPHFRTENGAIVKVYQETTGVAAATLVGGGGTALTDTDTFDGYTLKQIVKALRNQGLLA